LQTLLEFQMRYLRPYDVDALSPGSYGDWLLGPGDGAGLIVRLRRGGGPTSGTSVSSERFALVLRGAACIESNGSAMIARSGELAFIPAGSTGSFAGDADALWAEIETDPIAGSTVVSPSGPKVIRIDHSKFEGSGFAYQSLIDRNEGACTMRVNVVQVQPGAGSPDWHIHAFAQLYFIQEGEMTIEIGRASFVAGPDTLVFLPAGVVHRNFNSSSSLERHVSLLVPEPKEGEIFDYAVTIHPHEAELLTTLPSNHGTGARNASVPG
jgi:mannose-6-phosphate isomerase-like protein (cupin superfamily)